MTFVSFLENTESNTVEYVCEMSVEYNKNLQEQALMDFILHIKCQWFLGNKWRAFQSKQKLGEGCFQIKCDVFFKFLNNSLLDPC